MVTHVFPGLNVSNLVVPHWKLNFPGSFHYKSRVSRSPACLSCREFSTYIDLSIDNGRVGNVGSSNRVRTNVHRSGEESSHRLTDGFYLGFGDAFKCPGGCPVIAESL
jgi:hypothetical protein